MNSNFVILEMGNTPPKSPTGKNEEPTNETTKAMPKNGKAGEAKKEVAKSSVGIGSIQGDIEYFKKLKEEKARKT